MILDYDVVFVDVWWRCQLLFVCSLGNLIGVVIDEVILKQLIELVDEYDFIIVFDECYLELYFDELNLFIGLL